MRIGKMAIALIRHRAARHQWSVSNPLLGSQSWDLGSQSWDLGSLDISLDMLWYVVLRDHKWNWQISRDRLHDFFAGMFLLCFFVSIFSDFNAKKHRKMESKSTQIQWKMMSVAILKKVSGNLLKILDFSFIFQEADVRKS